MTHEELVRGRVEAINTGDFDALGVVMATDVITHYASAEAVHGLEALAGLLASFSAFSDMVVNIDDLAVEGDFVGARYTSRARQQGEFLDIPNTGAHVNFTGASLHRIKDGEIAEVWTVDDWAALVRQVRAGRLPDSTSVPRDVRRDANPKMVEHSKRVVSHSIDLANARAFELLSEDWALDATVHGSSDLEDISGLDSYVTLLKSFYAGIPDLTVHIEDAVGEGNAVFLRTTNDGTHTGELFGVPGSGRRVSFQGIATYYLDQGKIVHQWVSDDIYSLKKSILAVAAIG